ncbi:hypothetical protein PAHAL_6G125000 [Panicum hallii]|jgi:hypothetical protein|uniref:Uncharacterized protein n=1 Tax=Panicum hallii TaxID=206008 RepID=A0A2T8IG19_9POAL|nr:hypothetical protein PAHAL_6G125000 [Panicum hallii]
MDVVGDERWPDVGGEEMRPGTADGDKRTIRTSGRRCRWDERVPASWTGTSRHPTRARTSGRQARGAMSGGGYGRG